MIGQEIKPESIGYLNNGVESMKRKLDTIQFENRAEINELMMIIDKYVSQNPREKENKILKNFFNLLDVIDMEW